MRVALVLLILVILAAAVFVGAFSMGRQAGVGMLKPLTEHMRAAEGECNECNTLAAQVSDLRDRNTSLRQLQQIDRVVNRNLIEADKRGSG